jgi:uncharacterized protein
MISMILKFAGYMRQNGLTVSTSALHNSISAMKWIDPLNKVQVFSAFESCLVQSMSDREKFKKVFVKFFEEKSLIELEHEEVAYRMQVQEFASDLRKDGDYVGKILADYMDGEVVGLLQNLGEDQTFRTVYNDTASGLGMSKKKVRADIIKRIERLNDKAVDFASASFHLSREKREALSDYLRKQLEDAAELLKNKPKKRKPKNHLLPWEKQRAISSISFDKLTMEEQERVKQEVERIAQKLKDALSRQKKKARRGHLDVKNTIRHSMKFNGVPFNIKTRRPSRKKGKIIALCDISMSVAYAAQFTLLLLYRLQNRFSKIRSFVFIRNAYEISDLFQKYPLESALKRAIKQHHIGMGQLTNYGATFKSFLTNYPEAITRDTTILILGDALNNCVDPQVQYLKEMSEKATRTIWLNPEEEKYWYTSSSSIKDYEPYCTQVVECATIDQLSDFASNLVL